MNATSSKTRQTKLVALIVRHFGGTSAALRQLMREAPPINATNCFFLTQCRRRATQRILASGPWRRVPPGPRVVSRACPARSLVCWLVRHRPPALQPSAQAQPELQLRTCPCFPTAVDLPPPPPPRPRLTRMAAAWSAYTPARVKNERAPVKLVPGPKKTEKGSWMVVEGGEARPENEADDRAVEVRLIEAGKAAVDKRIEEELGEVGAMLTYAVPEEEFGTLPPNHILKFLVTRRAEIEAYAESVRKETTAKLLEAGGLKAKPRKELDFLAGIPYEFVQKVTNFFYQKTDVLKLLEEIDENTAQLLRKGEDGRTLADDWRTHTVTVQDMPVFGDIIKSRFFSKKDQEIFTNLRQATQAERDHPAWKTLLFSELPNI